MSWEKFYFYTLELKIIFNKDVYIMLCKTILTNTGKTDVIF